MLNFMILFLLIFVPGLVSALVFNLFDCDKIKTCCRFLTTALIFDLFILIINLAGLYFFKGICTLDELIWYFGCLSFTFKYGLLSLLVGFLLAVIVGIITWLCCRKKRCKN